MSMIIIVTATEANRNFSKLLRDVDKGKRVKITSHGRDIAELSPPSADFAVRDKRAAAIAALKAEWATQPHVVVGEWTRDDICSRF